MSAPDTVERSWLGDVEVPPISNLDLTIVSLPPKRWRRRSTWCVVFSGLAAAFASGHPTVLLPVDVVLRVVVGLAFVEAASRARRRVVRRSTMIVAGSVLVGAVVSPISAGVVFALVLALAGVAVALVAALQDDRSRWMVAFAGGLTGQSALRIPTALPERLPSAIAGFAFVLLVVSAWPNQSRRSRGRYRRIGYVVGGAAVLATVGGAASVFLARADLENGLSNARRGLVAARAGDTSAATPSFERARVELLAAHDTLGGLIALPARAVPVVAQHLEIVRRLTGTASEVAATATQTLDGAQLQSFRAEGGRIDVQRMRDTDVRVRVAEQALRRARAAIHDAQGPWLYTGILQRGLRFDAELGDAQRTVEDVHRVLDVVPKLLGIDGPRRYLLVVGNPGEARGTGGVFGNFGEVTAENGTLRLVRLVRTEELNKAGIRPDARRISGPPDYVARYAADHIAPIWSNVNLSPHFPSVARVMAELYPQSGGRTVDGVISTDPVALAALLKLTGPVSVESWPEPISSDNAAKLLMFDLYREFGDVPGGRKARVGLLGDVTEAVWKALTSTALPPPATVGAALRDSVAGGHLKMWSTRESERQYLDSIGIGGSAAGTIGEDMFGLIVNNADANKIQWFLKRSTTYDVSFDPATRRATTTATIKLTNTAPTSGLAEDLIGNQIRKPVGSSSMLISAFSAGALQEATIQGEPFNLTQAEEFGREVRSAWIDLAAGETVSLQFSYFVTLSTPDYQITLLRQPQAQDQDTTEVHVHLSDGWIPSKVIGFSSSGGQFDASVAATGPNTLVLEGVHRTPSGG